MIRFREFLDSVVIYSLPHRDDSNGIVREHWGGFWGHWILAKKYHDDTPGQDWKRISKLIKKYKAER